MPLPKLIYFACQGRAEVIRMLYAAAKKPFDDVRIGFSDWPSWKPSTPHGGLPVLELDGEKYGQALAIATYVANENGLKGSSNMDAFIIDQVQQLRDELLVASATAHYATDDAEKAELGKKLVEEDIPKFFQYFVNFINENPAKSGLVVGDKVTLGDIAIYVAIDSVAAASPDALDKHPELKHLRSIVEETDGIKQYLATRPPSES